MKALSIKQPWASLIAHGIKDIENRTWKTHFRGRIYIHASGKASGNLGILLNDEQIKSVMNNGLPEILFSAIIGEVDIVDCVINHKSIWAEHAPSDEPERFMFYAPIYNWVLANAVLYDEPILNIKGKLSFWKYSKFPCLDYQAGSDSCTVQCDNCKD